VLIAEDIHRDLKALFNGKFTEATNPTVFDDDYGSTHRLTVVFRYAGTLPGGHFLEPATNIDVYAYREDVTGHQNRDIASYKGNWAVGDDIRFTIDVPAEFFDESLGWNLRYCIGASRCWPSPNLLDAGTPNLIR
jgi:hypothetical protein